jgi:sulfur carrier protein ThiS
MAHVHFTAHLRAIVNAPQISADGRVVGEALNKIFQTNTQLKGYVLDEQGALRQHVCVFLDGERLPNRTALDAPIEATSEIYVMQALSGG